MRWFEEYHWPSPHHFAVPVTPLCNLKAIAYQLYHCCDSGGAGGSSVKNNFDPKNSMIKFCVCNFWDAWRTFAFSCPCFPSMFGLVLKRNEASASWVNSSCAISAPTHYLKILLLFMIFFFFCMCYYKTMAFGGWMWAVHWALLLGKEVTLLR